MSAVLDFSTKLEVHHCPTCAIAYAAPMRFFKERREDKATFYCPSGHGASYKESETDRLRRELEREKQNTQWWKTASKESQIKGVNIQLGKVKAKLKRTETRVAHGVCPCCNRSFQNVAHHMKTKHPDYAGESE